MNRFQALAVAIAYKKILLEAGIPVIDVRLFGSMAADNSTEDSDIDIAVIVKPFLPSVHDENTTLRKLRRPLSRRIETVCLHEEDLKNKYFTLAEEVKAHGISV